jgi:hypothetical protein
VTFIAFVGSAFGVSLTTSCFVLRLYIEGTERGIQEQGESQESL